MNGFGVCHLEATQAVFDRCVFSSCNGIYLTGASIVSVVNSVYITLSTILTPFIVGSGGSLTWDYCLVVSPSGVSTTRITDGGHNIITASPLYTAYPPTPAVAPTVCFTVDDTSNIDDFALLCSEVFDPLSIKATLFTSPGQYSGGDAATLAALSTAGHEISNHSMNHADLTSTNAFMVTSTNTNPTIDVDYATTTITLFCDEVGNRITFDWSGDKKISDLQTAVVGKGWTITPSTSANGVVFQTNSLLDSLADTAGAKAVPYTCAVDSGRFLTNEIDGAKTAIAAITGVTPTTMATPYGHNNAALLAWLDAAGYLSARGIGEIYQGLDSIPRYNVLGIENALGRYNSVSTEAFVRNYARTLYAYLACRPSIVVFYNHSMTSGHRQRHAWFVDEFVLLGGVFVTYESAMTAINADHTYGSRTWTKTYDTSGADYTPQAGSALLAAGSVSSRRQLLADYYGTAVAPSTNNIGCVQE